MLKINGHVNPFFYDQLKDKNGTLTHDKASVFVFLDSHAVGMGSQCTAKVPIQKLSFLK